MGEPKARRTIRALLGTVATALLLALLVRQVGRAPDEALARLKAARPGLILAGLAVYALAYAARAVRLNLLLPRAERIPFGRAWALSGAATFLLQVIPFRGGELASWALYRGTLGLSWSRAAAVFLVVKLVDSATLLLAGLAGAGVLAAERGSALLGRTTVAAAAVGTALLVVLPRLGGPVARWLAARMPEGSRRRTTLAEIGAGLEAVRETPGAYALAFGGALGFLAAHFVAVSLLMTALATPVSLAALAFASITAVLSSALVPSPAGTFGPMESGFAAGLAVAGIPVAAGAPAAVAVHVLTTIVAGLVGLPLLRGEGRVTPPASR